MSALLASFAASLSAEQEQTRSTQSELSFTLRPSLWSHLSSLLLPAERDEALQLISSPFIADNAKLEEEIRALLDIASVVHQHQPNPGGSSASISSTSPSPVPRLPSLLGLSQRERLKEEIACLIAALREKASERGEADEARMWTPRSEREKAIVQLVEKERRVSSRSDSRASSASYRASSTRSRPSSSTSDSSASNGRSSRPHTVSAALPAVASLSSLSIFTLDAVLGRIREALQDEYAELVRDADFLRAHLEEEEAAVAEAAAASCGPFTAQPTEVELRAVEQQLVEAVRQEEERERTLRLLQSVPHRAAFRFKAKSELIAGVESGVAEVNEQLAVDGLDSLLAAMEEMESSLRSTRTSSPAPHSPRTLSPPPDPLDVQSGPHSVSSLDARPPPAPSTSSVFTIRRPSLPSPSSSLPSRRMSASSLTRKKPSPHLPSLRGVES